jgi:hypothetical protein
MNSLRKILACGIVGSFGLVGLLGCENMPQEQENSLLLTLLGIGLENKAATATTARQAAAAAALSKGAYSAASMYGNIAAAKSGKTEVNVNAGNNNDKPIPPVGEIREADSNDKSAPDNKRTIYAPSLVKILEATRKEGVLTLMINDIDGNGIINLENEARITNMFYKGDEIGLWALIPGRSPIKIFVRDKKLNRYIFYTEEETNTGEELCIKQVGSFKYEELVKHYKENPGGVRKYSLVSYISGQNKSFASMDFSINFEEERK